MNEATENLLQDVVVKQKGLIRKRESPAIAALSGKRALTFIDYDYLRDETASRDFEERVAVRSQQLDVVRWVLAVPQVLDDRRAVSNHSLRPGEQEAITWMSYDREDGLEFGRVPHVIFTVLLIVVGRIRPGLAYSYSFAFGRWCRCGVRR